MSTLATGALLGARLRLRPRAAVEALVRAGLLLLGEDPGLLGLLSNRVGGGDDHQRLRPPLPVLLRRLLLVSGRRGLHRTGAEHGEICQAPILVHQSAGVGGGRLKTGPKTHTHPLARGWGGYQSHVAVHHHMTPGLQNEQPSWYVNRF